MEHKTWHWRRKPSDKIIAANGRASLSHESNVEEDQEQDIGSTGSPSTMGERSASVVCDCTAKEELIRKHARRAELALAGQQMAEAEAALLKHELAKTLQQGDAAQQKLVQLDAALNDCMQEIQSLQSEHGGRIHNAFSKATKDFERMQKKLEGKLVESNLRVSNLAAENSSLMKALLCKEKLIEDLDKGKGQLEVEFDMLVARLDSVEKENAFLKYECGVMEEELKLRTEEREYSSRSALENAKQIKRLEAECQQLHNLVRKRVQGPATAVDMKGEVVSMRRIRKNPAAGNSPEKPSRDSNFLIQRVHDLEEENKALREVVSLGDCELESWKIKCGQMASRLVETEVPVKELSKGERSMDLAISGFEVSKDGRIGDSDTWRNAVLPELKQSSKGNMRIEPESKASEARVTNSLVETDEFSFAITGRAAQHGGTPLQSTSKELILQANTCGNTHENGTHDSWLDEVLRVILEEHTASRRSFGDLLRDIKIVVGCYDDLSKQKVENHSNISGLLPWESSNSCTEESTLQRIPSNDIAIEEKGRDTKDASFASKEIQKHFGFDRSKSDNHLNASPNSHDTLAQMIKIQSSLQEETRKANEKLQLVTEENVTLKKELQESNHNIESLRREVDTLREAKGVIEDQMENQRLISEDLDTQLAVAKAKLNEIHHKLSSLEVELEDKRSTCEELEATCLELQLQLETFSRKDSSNLDIEQVTKILKTEMIENLEKRLDALASPDTTMINKALCPSTAITVSNAPSSGKKSLAVQRTSLRDRMLAEDDDEIEYPKTPNSEENLRDDSSLKATSIDLYDIKALPAPEPKVRSPEQVSTLAVVPSKKQSVGFGFIRKLFLRRKKGCPKMKTVPLQRNTSALIGPRDVLLVV